MLKKSIIVLLALLLIAGISFRVSVYPMLSIASGYAAKKMCSCHFIAERTQESIQSTDLSMSPLNLTKTVIDESAKSATSNVMGMGEMTAVYRGGVGCILLNGDDDYNVSLDLPDYDIPSDEDWPLGSATTSKELDGVNYEELNKAIDAAFEPSNLTRAVVVIHRDTLIAERYLDGFDKDTEIIGWSMTKAITSTLIGILAKDGKTSLNAKPQFAEWANDERNKIRLHHLLNMQSGLEFSEIYDEASDATNMLFGAEDVSDIPLNKGVIAPPDSVWSYASGTSNILSKYISNQFDDHEDYLKFPYERLFRKIGMASAILETDESGVYIGSSYMYATPRDWARYGLLYLNEGNWYGDQIVDTTWVDFSKSIAEKSGGVYGGHFWHNADHVQFPDVPADMFSANGFQGQRVWIFPSQDVVVVRMGLAGDDVFDMNKFLKEVLGSLYE